MKQQVLKAPREEAREYWEGLKQSRLRIQKCETCEKYIFYPRERCPYDFGRLEYADVSGRGRILSFTIVEKTHHPAYTSQTPFIMAVVQLEEGPRMLTHLVDIQTKKVEINQEVEVTFTKISDSDEILPMFSPVK